ncbi:MAG TPA: hypothetical protein VK629_07625 [Steroidobacteraceae bacterium]|nr:hypothetical protein [Steroidobacteraceae bacterium]
MDKSQKEKFGQEIGQHIAKKIAKIVAMVVGGIVFVLFFGFALGWLVQYLWNVTLASMFGWPAITYWQGIGIFILAKLLFGFGHFGGGGKHRGGKEKHHRGRGRWWRDRDATPDETSNLSEDEQFKKYWQEEGKAAYEAFAASRKEGERTKAGE